MRSLIFMLLALPCLALAGTVEDRLTAIEGVVCDQHGQLCVVVEPPPPADTDGDGVTDDIDQCPGTTAGVEVDSVGCEVVAPSPPPSGSNPLTSAPLNTWYEIPNTKLVDVLPPEAFEQPIRYLVGPSALATAWSGASWNEAAQEMHFIAGGGHADYCGNQHIKLDLDDLSVTLIRGPSSLGDKTYTELGDEGMTPDGFPNSRHTYGGTVYDSTRNQHYLMPGSSCDPAGDSDRKLWALDNETGGASLLMDQTETSSGWRGSRNVAIYDPQTDKVWSTNMGVFYRYDPVTNTRTAFQTNAPQFPYGFKQGGAFDESRRTMLLAGGGSFWTYNIDTNTLVKYATQGAEFRDCYAPGLTYSGTLDKYIAWCGGNDLYLVDPVDYSVVTQTTAGVAPTIASKGDHGKMRWSGKYGGLIVVGGSEENARFVKL